MLWGTLSCSGGTMDGLGMGGVHGLAMGGRLCGHGWDTHCLVMGWDTWSCNGWSLFLVVGMYIVL